MKPCAWIHFCLRLRGITIFPLGHHFPNTSTPNTLTHNPGGMSLTRSGRHSEPQKLPWPICCFPTDCNNTLDSILVYLCECVPIVYQCCVGFYLWGDFPVIYYCSPFVYNWPTVFLIRPGGMRNMRWNSQVTDLVSIGSGFRKGLDRILMHVACYKAKASSFMRLGCPQSKRRAIFIKNVAKID